MVKDEVKKHDDVVIMTGACRFCGQIAQVDAPPIWPEDMVNELATELCECNKATTYANMKKRREKAHEKIVLLFGEKASSPVNDNAEKLLHMAVDTAIDYDIESMTIDIGDGTKGKISCTTKGSIKIERRESSKNAYEL